MKRNLAVRFHSLSTAAKIVLIVFASAMLILSGALLGRALTPTPDPVVQIEKQTVTEYKTPQSCLDYIDYANQGFILTSESLMYNGEAITAVSEFDYEKLNTLSEKIRGVNAELDLLTPKLNTAKAACAASE